MNLLHMRHEICQFHLWSKGNDNIFIVFPNLWRNAVGLRCLHMLPFKWPFRSHLIETMSEVCYAEEFVS